MFLLLLKTIVIIIKSLLYINQIFFSNVTLDFVKNLVCSIKFSLQS